MPANVPAISGGEDAMPDPVATAESFEAKVNRAAEAICVQRHDNNLSDVNQDYRVNILAEAEAALLAAGGCELPIKLKIPPSVQRGIGAMMSAIEAGDLLQGDLAASASDIAQVSRWLDRLRVASLAVDGAK